MNRQFKPGECWLARGWLSSTNPGTMLSFRVMGLLRLTGLPLLARNGNVLTPLPGSLLTALTFERSPIARGLLNNE